MAGSASSSTGTRERPAWGEARRIHADDGPIRILRDEVLGGEHWHNMGYPYPVFIDWDGDGLPDLMLPNETNRIFWYRNIDGLMDLITHDGKTRKLTLFAQYRANDGELRLRREGPLRLHDGRLIDDSIVGRSQHWTERFQCVDWDGDGLLDIIYSCAGSQRGGGSIFLLRNCGTAVEPVFEEPVTMCCFGDPISVTNHGPHPWVGDLTGDGPLDLLACVEWSVYFLPTCSSCDGRQTQLRVRRGPAVAVAAVLLRRLHHPRPQPCIVIGHHALAPLGRAGVHESARAPFGDD